MARRQPYQVDSSGAFKPQTMALTSTAEELVYDLGEFKSAAVQIVDRASASHTGNTISVRQSNDGVNAQSFATPVTLTAAGITPTIEMATRYLHVGVTTVGSGAGEVDVFVQTKRN